MVTTIILEGLFKLLDDGWALLLVVQQLMVLIESSKN